MRAAAAVLFAASLALCWRAQAQNPPQPPQNGTPGIPAMNWDRDFDLIIESRQGTERENPKTVVKTEAIQKELETLRKEEVDLEARLKIFSGNVTGEEAMAEMMRLEVNSPDRARAILEEKLAEASTRIQDLEDDLKRLKRGRK